MARRWFLRAWAKALLLSAWLLFAAACAAVVGAVYADCARLGLGRLAPALAVKLLLPIAALLLPLLLLLTAAHAWMYGTGRRASLLLSLSLASLAGFLALALLARAWGGAERPYWDAFADVALLAAALYLTVLASSFAVRALASYLYPRLLARRAGSSAARG